MTTFNELQLCKLIINLRTYGNDDVYITNKLIDMGLAKSDVALLLERVAAGTCQDRSIETMKMRSSFASKLLLAVISVIVIGSIIVSVYMLYLFFTSYIP